MRNFYNSGWLDICDMRLATLFSGIGAPEQGAMRVYENINTVFACEIDKFARKSYSAIYGIPEDHEDFHRDIHNLDATRYKGEVDILVGGSPWQSFSIAGLRNGTGDERGQLIYQYIRVIDECSPPIIIYENVKGFLSITMLEYPHINNEELLWQEINQSISSSSKIMLGKYLLGKCAEYLTLKNIKSDISQIRNLASTLEKWESVVLIGMMKKLQSYLTQIKQTMKKQNSSQQEQTLPLECKEEDLDLFLNQLYSIENLSTEVINLLDIMEDMKKNQDLLFPIKLEELLQKMMLFTMLMEEKMTTQSKTYAYAMGKLNTLISIINLWKSSQNLWTEILSISISEISNIKSKLVFDDFMQELKDIGYHCHYKIINTKDYGVPQNRERLFLDADLYDKFEFAPKVKLEKRIKDVLEDNVDEKYYLSNKLIDGFIRKEQRYKSEGRNMGFCFKPLPKEGVSATITQRYYKSGASDPYIIEPTLNHIGNLDIKGNDSIKRVYDIDGISPTLTTMMEGNREPKIAASRGRNIENPSDRTPGNKVEQRLEINKHGTSNTITSVQKDNYVVQQHTIRKLTPLECWRLQDFPDTAHNKARDAGVSNTQLYRQAGNSMSVNVLAMIFSQIEKAKKRIKRS